MKAVCKIQHILNTPPVKENVIALWVKNYMKYDMKDDKDSAMTVFLLSCFNN